MKSPPLITIAIVMALALIPALSGQTMAMTESHQIMTIATGDKIHDVMAVETENCAIPAWADNSIEVETRARAVIDSFSNIAASIHDAAFDKSEVKNDPVEIVVSGSFLSVPALIDLSNTLFTGIDPGITTMNMDEVAIRDKATTIAVLSLIDSTDANILNDNGGTDNDALFTGGDNTQEVNDYTTSIVTGHVNNDSLVCATRDLDDIKIADRTAAANSIEVNNDAIEIVVSDSFLSVPELIDLNNHSAAIGIESGITDSEVAIRDKTVIAAESMAFAA